MPWKSRSSGPSPACLTAIVGSGPIRSTDIDLAAIAMAFGLVLVRIAVRRIEARAGAGYLRHRFAGQDATYDFRFALLPCKPEPDDLLDLVAAHHKDPRFIGKDRITRQHRHVAA